MTISILNQTRSANLQRRQRHPCMQLVQLVGLTLLGDLALLLVPLTTLASIGLSVWMFFSANTPIDWLIMEATGVIGAAGVLACFDLLFTRPAQPDGLNLTHKQAPELFAMLKRRTDQFRLKPVDRVLLADTPNIELIITPKRGIPGAYMQTLVIGWPLLSFLNFKQLRVALRAVLGQWAGTSGKICRQTAFWRGLRQHYAERTFPAAWLLRKPITIFANYYEVKSSEICRTQILEHDQLALDVTDDDHVLSLIAAEALGEAFLEKKFWPMIFAAAERTADPIVKPFTNLNAIMERTLYKEDAERWLLQAFAADNPQQSSLRERIAVLGYNELHWPGLPRQPALDALFGCQWQSIAAHLDHHWQQSVQQEWTDRHWRFRQDQDQFYTLQQQAAKEAVTGAAAIRYLRLAEQFLTGDELTTLCKRLLRVNRTNADVCFQCGKHLLEAGNDDGIRAIEIAIQLDSNYSSQGNKLIYAFERTNRVTSFRQAAIA